jgi:hypothetical protein
MATGTRHTNASAAPERKCQRTYYLVAEACVQPFDFARSGTVADRLPAAVRAYVPDRTVSRLIATSDGLREYLTDEGGALCLEVARHSEYWGGECFDPTDVVGQNATGVWLGGARVLVGVAGSQIALVRVQTRHGVKAARVTRRKGFLFVCSRACCRDQTAIAYVSLSGRVIARESLRGFNC